MEQISSLLEEQAAALDPATRLAVVCTAAPSDLFTSTAPEWAARLCRHGRPVPRSAAYAHGPHRPGQYSTRAQVEFLERVCQGECNYAEKLNLRRQVRALILMRKRGTLTALEVLPTLFRLFRCQDKALRQLLFRHIIAGELCNENISTFAEVRRALK